METIHKALIIFARKPVLGKVKTRLAASIGDDKAYYNCSWRIFVVGNKMVYA